MIGFVIGAAAIAGLVMMRRAHRRYHYAMAGCGDSWHGGWHGVAGPGRGWHGHGHWHGHGWRGGGWVRRGMEYRLLAELDCSPAQEKLVREELRGLVELVRGMRDEREQSREDLARAIAGQQMDRAALMEMFTRHDKRLVELRAAITASLERVHAALDDKQRERLAEMVREGLGGRWRGRHAGGGHGGPYRV
jgi:uncharacterized membrane protein